MPGETVKPLAPWDADDSFSHPILVWWAIVDKRYQVEVHRKDDSTGTLHIFNHDDDLKEKSISVTLAYGAQFGPDAEDVAEWRQMVLDYIDGEGI